MQLFDNLKTKIPKGITHGLKWGNKPPKLKMSIKLFIISLQTAAI